MQVRKSPKQMQLREKKRIMRALMQNGSKVGSLVNEVPSLDHVKREKLKTMNGSVC